MGNKSKIHSTILEASDIIGCDTILLEFDVIWLGGVEGGSRLLFCIRYQVYAFGWRKLRPVHLSVTESPQYPMGSTPFFP
jgi:hypothetical protein